MKKIWLIFVILFCLFFNLKVNAYQINDQEYIYVGGEAIGLRVKTDVCVAGCYAVVKDGKIYKPWESAGICDGDYIIKYNNYDITSTKSLLEAINAAKTAESDIVLKRNENIINTKITAVDSSNGYSLGLYIKDNILGVGTLTYYIPSLSLFGSLGHSITTANTYGGNIYSASVNSIVKSTKNFAGEKRATLSTNSIGNILVNSISGVHGKTNNLDVSNMKKMKYAKKEEVHTGEAYIRTCISGNKVEEFSINITKCYNQNTQDIKGLKIEITDERLLEKTGGIIQGMSGSPIIQDNKLVGAVTHVILSNPTEGYGIYLEFMYEDLNINISR